MKDTGLYHLKALATTGGIGAAQAKKYFHLIMLQMTINDYLMMRILI